MFKNLENILANKNISKKSLAEFLGVSEKTIQHRFSGEIDWTLTEVTKINKFLCPESKDVEELLNEICFMPVPYETRVEMCAAVVRAAREELNNADNGGY